MHHIEPVLRQHDRLLGDIFLIFTVWMTLNAPRAFVTTCGCGHWPIKPFRSGERRRLAQTKSEKIARIDGISDLVYQGEVGDDGRPTAAHFEVHGMLVGNFNGTIFEINVFRYLASETVALLLLVCAAFRINIKKLRANLFVAFDASSHLFAITSEEVLDGEIDDLDVEFVQVVGRPGVGSSRS
ncbi:hypothetical protein M422DRAFT_260432 [Sphaerobolus stellatus SS14]|uniref:Uncharacterized protein n=1 Tax=Sphaerobolus stellatus (strain SS14) TaxID=990650 RepID=A0A0C9VHM5_SPHS4|nr:hypothetical protein M422DRAFT_260432 [Sphaerobolus stellatus SS14]